MKSKENLNSVYLALLTLIFALMASILAMLLNGCGNSSLSSQEILDTSYMPAHFVIYRISDEAAGEVRVKAEAVFHGEALTTVALLNGEVELEDPQGNIYPLTLYHNAYGAPYYSASLPELTYNGRYTFHVTLANGSVISNSIRTPMEELEIIEPIKDQVIDKSEALDVRWTGSTNRGVTIVLGPERPNIFNMFELGGTFTHDDGLTVIEPHQMMAVTPGDNLLTMVRGTEVFANGFFNFSKIKAVFITCRPVDVELSS